MSDNQQHNKEPVLLNQESLRKRMALLKQIYESGGQKTFVIGEEASECFRFLAGLEVDGLVQLVPSKEPFSITYRLVEK